jgi:chemotaxis protein MotB
MPSHTRSRLRPVNAWPGWVDALSSLVMVVIFLLMIFVVSQFYLATTLTGRDEQLQKLSGRINELTSLLALERESNADLRVSIAQVSDQLQAAIATREDMNATLSGLQEERDALNRRAEELERTVKADRETVELRLKEAASLEADLKILKEAKADLESKIAALSLLSDSLRKKADAADETSRKAVAEVMQQRARADQADAALKLTEEQKALLMAELGTLRDRSKELDAKLADERERTVMAQKDIDARDIRIRELMAALGGEKALSADASRQVNELNAQMAALKEQLIRLNATLEASEKLSVDQKVQIVDLGNRLNQALATKVQELARYRSEFFGRVREVLGNRPDVRVVGDRFVFQSELLFPTGSATLQTEGGARLADFARSLKDVASRIPPDLNWVLRVDGHTDSRPIATSQFPSNWELSTARAISVSRFLMEQGIPPERLAVAGFGEYHPLDNGTSEEALARNRRIELKLDQR